MYSLLRTCLGQPYSSIHCRFELFSQALDKLEPISIGWIVFTFCQLMPTFKESHSKANLFCWVTSGWFIECMVSLYLYSDMFHWLNLIAKVILSIHVLYDMANTGLWHILLYQSSMGYQLSRMQTNMYMNTLTRPLRPHCCIWAYL